jgi:hypothetical protein
MDDEGRTALTATFLVRAVMLLPRYVLALQWVSNIKMRRMLLACFWCRITLWSLSAEAALPVVRKEGSSRGGFLVWDGG